MHLLRPLVLLLTQRTVSARSTALHRLRPAYSGLGPHLQFSTTLRYTWSFTSTRTLATMSDPADDDAAYLQFLQQANQPLMQTTTTISNSNRPDILHANTKTNLPSNETLAAAYQRLKLAAKDLFILSETESDLEVVHVPASDIPVRTSSTVQSQQFSRLLGASDDVTCEPVNVDNFFEKAADSAAHIGRANDASRWRQLKEVMTELLGDAARLQVWRVGEGTSVWIYAGGILPNDAGFIGVRALVVET
jgi:hypothetical protein